MNRTGSRVTDAPGSGVLGAVLAAAARGWPVFPLVPGGKTPAFRAAHPPGHPCAGGCGRYGHGYRDATTDPEVIAAWWRRRPTGNYGIATGPAGLVVIDVDAGKGPPPPGGPHHPGVLPDQGDQPTPGGVQDGAGVLAWLAARAGAPEGWAHTYTITTPSGGLHLYYAAPSDVTVKSSVGFTAGRVTGLGWCLDVRAAGGYVVGAGSHARQAAGRARAAGDVADHHGHAAGRDMPVGYRVGVPARVAALPAFLTKYLTAPTRLVAASPLSMTTRSATAAGQPPRWWPAAVAGELANIAAALAGGRDGSGRNATLNRAAYKLGRLVQAAGLDGDQVDDLAHQLIAAGTATGLPEREARTAVASGLGAGQRDPRAVTGRIRSPAPPGCPPPR